VEGWKVRVLSLKGEETHVSKKAGGAGHHHRNRRNQKEVDRGENAALLHQNGKLHGTVELTILSSSQKGSKRELSIKVKKGDS